MSSRTISSGVCMLTLRAKGVIQIFNRSHYEDILVTRVHHLIDDDIAKKRMKAINDFEQLLLRTRQHADPEILSPYFSRGTTDKAQRTHR